jgi:hypothetical protein
MGERSEELAATCGGSEVKGIGSGEAQHFSSKQEKDGGGCTGTLGGVPSGEEGGLASTARGGGVEECLMKFPMGARATTVPPATASSHTIGNFAVIPNGYGAIDEDECGQLANRVRGEFKARCVLSEFESHATEGLFAL